jgi:hypothetical protein
VVAFLFVISPMNVSRIALCRIGFLCVWVLLCCAGPAWAQQGGQDYWQWTGRALAVPNAAVSRKCITISNSAIYVGTLNASSKCTTVEQYTLAGAFTKTWTAAFTDVDGLASDTAGNVYAFDKGASRVRVFDAGGTQIRSFGTAGSGDGQFSASSGSMVHAIAVDDALNVYVADWGNRRVVVFDSSGTFKLKFGSQGDLPGQFQDGPAAVAWCSDGSIVAYDSPAGWYHLINFSESGSYIKRSPQETGYSYGESLTKSALFGFGGDKIFSASRDGLLIVGVETGAWVGVSGSSRVFQVNNFNRVAVCTFPSWATTRGGAFDSSGNFWAVRDKAVECLERRMRFDAHKPVKALPQPLILKVSQVPGSTVVDIDYTVTDTDSTTVETQMVAFTGGTRSLSALVLPKTFPSGKAGVLGVGTPTGTPLRVSWDAAADIAGLNFTTLAFEILAKDDRDLVGAHYVTIPSDAANLTSLKISNSPVLDSDLFDLWLWLLAQGDTRVSLSSAKVVLTSTGQSYISGLPSLLSGTSVANTAHNGSVTTTQGRQFAYKLMNARAITAAEKTRAAAGNFKLGSVSDNSIISLAP